MSSPEEVLKFWLDETDPKNWYVCTPDFDQKLRDRFEDSWNALMEGRFGLWLTYPSGALAYLILADQFPRNMFRDNAKAFASDKVARTVAKAAISKEWDLKIDPPARQFFYMPLMHSENLFDQDQGVRLFSCRMPGDNLLHARTHREIIRRFGRFPYRNAALGRRSTDAEMAFLTSGGYGAVLNELNEKAA